MALKALTARITTIDRWLILLVLAATLSSFIWSFNRPTGRQVLVYGGDRLLFAGPLAQDRLVAVAGPLGETRIRIEAGEVRVFSSPCPQKICIGMGAVDKSGDLLACVPNRVTVRIEGDEAMRDYDLLSR